MPLRSSVATALVAFAFLVFTVRDQPTGGMWASDLYIQAKSAPAGVFDEKTECPDAPCVRLKFVDDIDGLTRYIFHIYESNMCAKMWQKEKGKVSLHEDIMIADKKCLGHADFGTNYKHFYDPQGMFGPETTDDEFPQQTAQGYYEKGLQALYRRLQR